MNTNSLIGSSVQLVAFLALEVGLLIVAVAVLARWTRSAWWRRVLWQAAIVGAACLTACELSGAGRLFAGWAKGTPAWHRDALPSSSPEVTASALQLSPEFRSQVESRLADRSHAISRSGASTNQPTHRAAVPPSRPDVFASTIFGPPPPKPQPDEFGADSIQVLWLWLAWATGTVLLAGRAVLGRCVLLVGYFRRRQVSEVALLERVRTLADALDIRRRIRVVESKRLRGPIAFGLVFPTIGLPRYFSTRFTPAQQDAMLAHELAHLAVHDPAWSLISDLTAALLWWHPVVWWTRREFHLASELVADEASLVLKDGPALLAECLLHLGVQLSGGRTLGQFQVSGFRSHLGRRVQRLVRLDTCSWSPPPRWRTMVLLALGPLAMAAIVVLCTAWATPRALTKGSDMKSMQSSLKRSLATLALLAAANSPEPSAVAARPGSTPATPPPAVAPASVDPKSADPTAELPAAFLTRYGLTRPPGVGLAPHAQVANPKREKIEAMLEEIILPEIQIDGLPLSEVVKMLSDRAAKLDPKKKGINFLINANVPSTTSPTIDPATGLAVSAPVETIDVNIITVRFSLPLRNVSLKDTLEAVVKVAERPIEYSVEDYGVVVSAKETATPGVTFAARPAPAPEPLFAATFKVDTNTFLAGLENAFGITVPKAVSGPSGTRAREIQSALATLLAQLGVSADNSKTVYYNDLNGMVMVRGTSSEQGLIQAAIETLGGTPAGYYGAGGGFGMSTPIRQ